MTQEIAVIDNTAIAQAFAIPSGIDVLIQRIKSEASAEVPDLTTKKANKEHMRRINREALAGIVAVGISEEQGKALIKAIASGAVPHVSIAY